VQKPLEEEKITVEEALNAALVPTEPSEQTDNEQGQNDHA